MSRSNTETRAGRTTIPKPAPHIKKVRTTSRHNPTSCFHLKLNLTPFKACQRQEGNEVTKEISVSFGVGGSFDVGAAVETGLDFGVSVAYSTTKTEATVEPCPASNGTEPCVCGIQYKAFRQEAWGTEHSSNACGHKVSKDFDVTAPVVKGDKQDPWIQWRPCRSSLSKCSAIESMPLCADGV